jgi:hypothetical protein
MHVILCTYSCFQILSGMICEFSVHRNVYIANFVANDPKRLHVGGSGLCVRCLVPPDQF